MRLSRTLKTFAVAAVAAIFALPAQAATTQVSGSFDSAEQPPLACGLRAILCATGNFSGGINGSYVTTITSLLPSVYVAQQVFFFTGGVVITTGAGQLRCNLAGALAATKDGAFGEICVITGGTGAYAGATGNLRLAGGIASGVLPVLGLAGVGDYSGTIVTPNGN